jgi:hypothetical protein
MSDRSGTFIVASVGAAVLLIAGAFVLLRPPPAATPTAGEAPVSAELGVQAREFDGARRQSDDDDAGRADARPVERPAPPSPRTVIEAPQDPGRRPTPPPVPAPPLVLSDAQLAANAAHEALKTEVAAQVKDSLRGQHSKLKNACWQAELGEMLVHSNMSFGADGKLLAMGFSESRGGGAGGIGACLSAQGLSLEVEPPGKTVSVDVELQFP